MTTADILLRLLAAAALGIVIGLNRYMHHKSVGVRTLGLIAVTASAITIALAEATTIDGVTRGIQGLVTGIGFIGAGLIMHQPGDQSVHGLTTATTVWVAMALGIMCGLGSWQVLLPAAFILVLLLLMGGKFEKAIARHFGGKGEPNDGGDAPSP